MRDHLHIAYVMYWGALEPVGLATAVPTVLRMARKARVTLLSFEKEEDEKDSERSREVRDRLREAGVRWIPRPYTPGYRATPLDAWRGLQALRRAHRDDPVHVVEGRTFVGGGIGAAFSRLHHVPFLYHTEGCWLDEQVDVGRLGETSPLLRILRGMEAGIVRQAGGLVVLTEAGEERFRRLYLRKRPRTPVLIVPTTSVLVEEAPPLGPSPVLPPDRPVRCVYMGSVSGRYLLDEMLLFFRELASRRPGSTLEILAHRERDRVKKALQRQGLGQELVSVSFVPHSEIPIRLADKELGFFFLKGELSGRCCSPTKIPEYLAHGVSVVSTRASGDGARVLERGRVGVVVENPGSAEDRRRALWELDELLQDPERSLRGQAVAREHYSLEDAVESQMEVLRRLAKDGPR